MYEKAKIFIPQIQKTFEETLIFHNEMIQQKIQFITEELPLLESYILEKKNIIIDIKDCLEIKQRQCLIEYIKN